MERHFVTSIFIVSGDKTLLHKHKKLGFWLPVGGHLDEKETPEDAAVREVKEECGLEVEFHNPDIKRHLEDKTARFMMRPAHLTLELIEPEHEHMDFIYYARAKNSDLNPGSGESAEMGWFTADEVEGLQTPADVKVMAREAINIFNK